MARITVEDCLTQIPNRFQMTLAVAFRARQVSRGTPPLVETQYRDKPSVVALRELAGKAYDETILNKVKVSAE